MEKNYNYFDGEKDKEYNISKMYNYVKDKQEIDKVLEKIISPIIEDKKLKILDACCGIGHISNLLSQISPKSIFLGIDQSDYLIEEAKKISKNKNNLSFEIGDLYNISNKFQKEFDISIIWKTISWLPYYEQIIKELVSVTKDHIFISSLFYDGDIDFEIKVREFKKESAKDRFNSYYNVYSLPRFKKYVYGLGAKNIEVYNFDINLDIPKPPIDEMGTYTEKLGSGKKIQISGAVVMSWKIIRVDL
jgi:ubiquinone/menaquinone biosynthesis C-methylase UbiE